MATKRKTDFFTESRKLDDAFASTMKMVPPAPGSAIAPRKKHHAVWPEERYRIIKKRVKKRLASRFIDDPAGQEAYVSGSMYSIIGKWKCKGDLLDWDGQLRKIEAKADAALRLKLLIHVAKALKVRT